MTRLGVSGYAIVLILPALLAGCGRQVGEVSASGGSETVSDLPLADFQKDLLLLAFDAATAIPVDPHVKDRSRVQEAVVAACLELHQPVRARAYLEKIDNWRRGTCFADLAFYCARSGAANEARECVDEAARIAKDAVDWRKDRIRVKIARVHALLGEDDKAADLSANVEAAEIGKVDHAKAIAAAEESFDDRVKALDELVATKTFDIVRNALWVYAELFDRFYDHAEKRALSEGKIKDAWNAVPIFIRSDLLMKLSRSALDHADKMKALELVDEAQTMMDGIEWPVEYQVPLMAKLARLRHEAGDEEKASALLKAALALFDAKRHLLLDIERAPALHPIAEAYPAMGDRAGALAVYRRAAEEGVVNPNSRPRAEDLSATCRSMALHGVEPDAQLWRRLRRINEELGPPW